MTRDLDAQAGLSLAGAIEHLGRRASLSSAQAADAFGVLMRGAASPAQIAALLMGLRVKGETADEIAGAAAALRGAMICLPTLDPDRLVDTCGTGGGTVGTLNVSTAAGLVCAGAGIPVAKHGNRSHTSRCGSADVVEALGIDITLAPQRAAEVLEQVGFAFLFAPAYHPAMRHVGGTRKELGIPTIMNLLGPLVNPAGVRRQVIGVSDPERAPLLAAALGRLGASHALVVHGEVGMDEISPSGSTTVWEVRDGAVARWTLDPAQHGLADDGLAELAGGEPMENARRIEELLEGGGARVVRYAVVLNAAAALYVAGRGWSFAEAATRAADALRHGSAARVLQRLRQEAPASAAGQ